MSPVTDPSEEYFKDGLWGWVTNQWKTLVATAGGALHIQFAGQEADVQVKQTAAADLVTGGHGWDGDSWQKLPMIWGYWDRYVQALSSLGVASGNRDLIFSAPGAGEVWVITRWAMWTSTATPAFFRFYLHNTAGYQRLQISPNPGVNTSVVCEGEIILKATDYLYAEFQSCAGGEDIYSSACGYKMKIAE